MSLDIVLECEGVSHWFGANKVLFDVNLKIIRGEIVALVGPSGCGKSTLHRAVVGTHPPNDGRVIVKNAGSGEGRVLNSPSRDCGIVYQQYSLYPFLTALENVAIGPMLDETSIPYRMLKRGAWKKLRKKHLEDAEALLVKLKLGGAIKNYPHEMSGGMRQRVAIAQALIMKPQILLLDEPFGALDEATREELQKMLLNLYMENRKAMEAGEPPPYTIMIVTHEFNEAIYVGDRCIVLSQYWNWKEERHEKCPGATIVMDSVLPVYDPDQERNFETFIELRNTIRTVGFDTTVLQPRDENHLFWDQLSEGRGGGVLA